MSQQLLAGRLKILPQNSSWDLPYVKQKLNVLSEPKLKKDLFNEQITFWSVEFTTTAERWREIEPELVRRHIEVNLYDAMPDLHLEERRAEERYLKYLDEKSKRQMIWLAGLLIVIAGGASLFTINNTNLSSVLMLFGFLVIALGRTLVERFQERVMQSGPRSENLLHKEPREDRRELHQHPLSPSHNPIDPSGTTPIKPPL